jgi:hypothetical protein
VSDCNLRSGWCASEIVQVSPRGDCGFLGNDRALRLALAWDTGREGRRDEHVRTAELVIEAVDGQYVCSPA